MGLIIVTNYTKPAVAQGNPHLPAATIVIGFSSVYNAGTETGLRVSWVERSGTAPNIIAVGDTLAQAMADAQNNGFGVLTLGDRPKLIFNRP